MRELTLPDGHVWLRVVRPEYTEPFDMSFAATQGGRWNPPGSWPTLYVNEDMPTVHAQVRHMFVGRGVEPDDLDDAAPLNLAACTLPRRQLVADAHTEDGVSALRLPSSYPVDRRGRTIPHGTTQTIGATVNSAGLRGVWCRSAAGVGTELAWFPAERASARATWSASKPFGEWRHARDLEGVTTSH